LTANQVNDYVKKMEIARDINNAMNLDYSEFWKQAEMNKGIIR
jgi:hypothetical protein